MLPSDSAWPKTVMYQFSAKNTDKIMRYWHLNLMVKIEKKVRKFEKASVSTRKMVFQKKTALTTKKFGAFGIFKKKKLLNLIRNRARNSKNKNAIFF